jgi:hypothetical protein
MSGIEYFVSMQDFLNFSEDPAESLKGVLAILESGPKRPGFLDKPSITARRKPGAPKLDVTRNSISAGKSPKNSLEAGDKTLGHTEAENVLKIIDGTTTPRYVALVYGVSSLSAVNTCLA